MIIEHMIVLFLECFKTMLGFQKVVGGDWLDEGNEEKERVMIMIKHDSQDLYLYS